MPLRAVAVWLVGVSLLTPIREARSQRVATQRLVWPTPPEAPRVVYTGSLRSEADFGKKPSFFSKMFRSLAGGRAPLYRTVRRPFDVLADRAGVIYVTDGLLPAVLAFDTKGKTARQLGEDVPGGLLKPMGIAGDRDGRLYVADAVARRVVVFGPDGSFLRTFGSRDDLQNPVDVAPDPARNRYYVVDSYRHQVLVYDVAGTLIARIGRSTEREEHHGAASDGDAVPVSPGHEGNVRTEPSDTWRNRGDGPGDFRYPFAVAVLSDGAIAVSDQMNFRVQLFDASGAYLRTIGSLGNVPGTFARPKGIAVDADDHLYVADGAFNNIQIFDREGRLLLAFGTIGLGEGEHWLPMGVAVDGSGGVYVADRFNNRIQLYRILSDSLSVLPRREADHVTRR